MVGSGLSSVGSRLVLLVMPTSVMAASEGGDIVDGCALSDEARYPAGGE